MMRDQMHGQRAPPAIAIEREATCQPDDEWGEQRPRVPVAAVQPEQQPDRRRTLREEGDVLEGLEGGVEGEQRGDAEDHPCLGQSGPPHRSTIAVRSRLSQGETRCNPRTYAWSDPLQ